MEWMVEISGLLTNALRILAGFYLVTMILKWDTLEKKAVVLAGAGAIVEIFLSRLSLSQMQFLSVDALLLLLGIRFLEQSSQGGNRSNAGKQREENRIYLFLIIFYEIGVALWEFILSVGCAVLFQNASFLQPRSPQHLTAVWLVRGMLLVACVLLHRNQKQGKDSFPMAVALAVVSLMSIVFISSQTIIALDEDTLSTWMILTVVFMFAIMVFNMNRQYEVEKENASLKAQQAELLQKDYQTLNKTYSANAKLYHDLHHHVEAMYQMLKQEQVDRALEYLEDLRKPIKEITKMVWTGDETIDYLINSKLSEAQSEGIEVQTNIEFPRHTNIRSANLVAILGNLLDNALEAVRKDGGKQAFIHLTIRRIHNMLVIKVKNSMSESLIIEEGQIQTTKQDKKMHGWGLKSARTAAEEYDGTIEIMAEDNTFVAVATLFFEPLHRKP